MLAVNLIGFELMPKRGIHRNMLTCNIFSSCSFSFYPLFICQKFSPSTLYFWKWSIITELVVYGFFCIHFCSVSVVRIVSFPWFEYLAQWDWKSNHASVCLWLSLPVLSRKVKMCLLKLIISAPSFPQLPHSVLYFVKQCNWQDWKH